MFLKESLKVFLKKSSVFFFCKNLRKYSIEISENNNARKFLKIFKQEVLINSLEKYMEKFLGRDLGGIPTKKY